MVVSGPTYNEAVGAKNVQSATVPDPVDVIGISIRRRDKDEKRRVCGED